jgi:hypothetical protein
VKPALRKKKRRESVVKSGSDLAHSISKTGLSQEEVERGIEEQVNGTASRGNEHAPFGGRVVVGGKTIEYRGYGFGKWKCQHRDLIPGAMIDRSPDDLNVLDKPRDLREDERALIGKLLAQSFNGRDEVAAQLQGAQVIAEGVGDTRTLRFAAPCGDAPPAPTALRIPVEGIADDADGVAITVLLHVVDRWVTELEVYRVDGKAIRNSEQPILHTLSVNE